MQRIYLTIAVSLAITVGAYGDYTLTPQIDGTSVSAMAWGGSVDIDVVLTSDASDSHYASLFTVEFSKQNLTYSNYLWGAPYETGGVDDYSSPSLGELPLSLDANTFISTPGPDPGTIDAWFENIVPMGDDQNPVDNPFTTGTIVTITVDIPSSFPLGQVTITVIPDLFDDGFASVPTSAGGSLTLNIYSFYGDTNMDGYVDDADLSMLLAGWHTGTQWGQGDLNDDDNVDDADLSLFLANWHKGTPPPLAGGDIPEPATLILMGLLAPALIRRVGR